MTVTTSVGQPSER